jgi:hypothetical protein
VNRWLVFVWLTFVALTFSHCRRSTALARLESRQNVVDRDERAHVGSWKSADVGAQFFVGDGVRTQARSTAGLRLSDGSALRLDENTMLRFLERHPGSTAPRVNLEFGGAELSARDEPMSIEAAFGSALLAKRGRIRVERSSEGVRFEVTIGSADVSTKQGTVLLRQGEPLSVDVTGAVTRDVTRASAREENAPALAREAAIPAPDGGGIAADVKGPGVRVRNRGEKDWRDLAPGTGSLPPGATLWIPADATVGVRRQRERTILRGPGEFELGTEGRPLVEAKSGSAALEANDEPVTLQVPGGTIVVDPRSRADLLLEERGVRVSVSHGTVSLNGTRDRAELRAGEQAKLEREGSVQVLRRYGLSGADVIVGGETSFIVHDPEPPTVVGFPVEGRCPGTAIVELGRGGTAPATVGTGKVNAPLPAGVHDYAVRCIPEDANQAPVLRGKIVVIRDSGTPRLPKFPADTTIDADGRRYSILYQSAMPRIVVRWPGAPAGSDFQLALLSESGRVRRVRTSGPAHTFAPGMVPEGTHQLTFEAPGKRSRPTTLVLRFDNAAPTASIVSPADKSFQRGQRVAVVGAALPGWQVTIGEMPLTLDAGYRFSGEITAPTAQRALVVRLQHPQRGTHYYLRRGAGAAP